MGQIRTTNKRRKRKARQRHLRHGAAIHVTALAVSKRSAVNAAVETRLVAEGRGLPHDPDGVMEGHYNYGMAAMPAFLIGVNQELRNSSPYHFVWDNAFITTAVQDTLRKFKARVESVAV